MDSKIDGVMWAIEKLRELQNKSNHTSIWNHSATSKFAPVELSDYLVIEFKKLEEDD